MTNTQLYLAIGIPLVTNLAVMLFLFGRLEARSDKLAAEVSLMRHDIIQFYHLTGKLEGRVDSLESRSK